MLRAIVYHSVLSAVFLLSFVDNASCAEPSAGTTGMSDDSTDVKNARKMFNQGEMLFKRAPIWKRPPRFSVPMMWRRIRRRWPMWASAMNMPMTMCVPLPRIARIFP